jgi:hypothetical protein
MKALITARAYHLRGLPVRAPLCACLDINRVELLMSLRRFAAVTESLMPELFVATWYVHPTAAMDALAS